MERQSYQEECGEVKNVLKDVKCIVCGKDNHSSASTSSCSEDICTCQCSSGTSTTNLPTPSPAIIGSRPCKHASAGCSELIVSMNSDHETFCGYRNTYCKDESCGRPVLIKDLIQHVQKNHKFVTGDELVLYWSIPDDEKHLAFPMYAFGSLIWEIVIFHNYAISITFFHGSPSRFNPRLLVSVCIKVHDVQFADTVRVLNFGDEPGMEKFSLDYNKIKLYWDLQSAYGCRDSDRQRRVRQGLRIIRDTS